jgi:SEC-C motif
MFIEEEAVIGLALRPKEKKKRMLEALESYIDEFCESNYFLLLDPSVKEHGLGIIVAFLRECRDRGAKSPKTVTLELFEQSLFDGMAQLDLPLLVRKGIPTLLSAFFRYLSESGKYPPASDWEAWIQTLSSSYMQKFRPDGTVKGETFRKKYTDVDRNDPCPCGSGKKFKKCCMKLLS